MIYRLYECLVSCLIVCGVLAGGCLPAQTAPPKQPFQAVHLLWIDAQQPNAEGAVLAAMAVLNQAITKAGCPECTYHLWKVVDAADGSYNYVQISSWPSGEIYDKVHNSSEYSAASRSWGDLRSVVKKEVYNRYVETQPAEASLRSELLQKR